MLRFNVVVFILYSMVLGMDSAAVEPPRITVVNGKFVEKGTGKTFVPVGMNYYRVGKVKSGSVVHAGFLPGFYDRTYIERMMKDLRKWGFNTVRTYHSYHVGEDGILTSPDAREISPEYLSNVVHFLRQARKNRIHVIFSWDIWMPPSKWWTSEPLPDEAKYELQPDWNEEMGVNDFRIHQSSVRTRANAICALIRAIRKVDSNLLSTVLSWELENEIYFVTDRLPFSSRTGEYKIFGKTYYMASDADVQRLMDDMIINWVNACAGAIRKTDPEALVSSGLFSFAAVGRGGPGTLSKDVTGDNRVPARPMALLRSRLDYLDIHLYAWKTDKESVGDYFKRNLSSIEWDKLKASAKNAGKPIMCGESGVFANYLRKPDLKIDHKLGTQVLREQESLVKSSGFAGALYWHYGNPDSTVEDECPAAKIFPQYAEVLKGVWGR